MAAEEYLFSSYRMVCMSRIDKSTRQNSFCVLKLERGIIVYRYFTKILDNETI